MPEAPGMPCNIGYQDTIPVRVEAQVKGQAPSIDGKLLERLGADDPAFVEWLDGLDTGPLLQAALDRLEQVFDTSGMSLELVAGGALQATGPDRARLDAAVRRWQLEVLGVVAQILGYDAQVTDRGVVGQRPTERGIEEHFTVTFEGGLRLKFEHFKSRRALESEVLKFIALARLLGLPLQADLDLRPGTAEREPGADGERETQ